MMAARVLRRCTRWVLSLLLAIPYSAGVQAFYQWRHGEGYGDLRAGIRMFALAADYPAAASLYPDEHRAGTAGILRLLAEGRITPAASFEFNLYQTLIPADLTTAQGIDTPLDAERSSGLEWRAAGQDYIHTAIDRLDVRYSRGHTDFTFGRLPVNLSTTFYFTPNDFFAPFSAQAFYRVYKPGVDGLRIDYATAPLSQLSYVAILGYRSDADSSNGWQTRPDAELGSHVLRYVSNVGDLEWGLLTGLLRNNYFVAVSLQGELAQWLGVRAEGNYREYGARGTVSASSLALGLEHRYESGLTLRLEQLYHGRGAETVSGYAALLADWSADDRYLARHYTALGLEYELTALLSGQLLWMINDVDQSSLLIAGGSYSLGDEIDLVGALSLPYGRTPLDTTPRSEFGLLPLSVTVELRSYF